MLDISRVADNLVEAFAISVCNTKYHKQCPMLANTSLVCRYTYMVVTTFSMDGKQIEIEVKGEPMNDIKGAKDSAAMQALVWFEDYGFVCR